MIKYHQYHKATSQTPDGCTEKAHWVSSQQHVASFFFFFSLRYHWYTILRRVQMSNIVVSPFTPIIKSRLHPIAVTAPEHSKVLHSLFLAWGSIRQSHVERLSPKYFSMCLGRGRRD